MEAARICQVIDLDRMEYLQALELQQRAHTARVAGSIPDTLLLVEHPPVITMGEGADEHDLLVPPDDLARGGIQLVQTNRGGRLTYHGPGQLVGYPVFDLHGWGRDVHRYVYNLEEAIILLLAAYGLMGERREHNPGVWVGDTKLAFIGVFVRRWVTMHGFSLNVMPELAPFSLFHPCGQPGLRIAALEELLQMKVGPEELRQRLVGTLKEVFSFDAMRWISRQAFLRRVSRGSLWEVAHVS